MSRHLRPIDLAHAAGVSAQSVRKYEELGFLPPAERSPSGHRRYTQRHLEAIQAARLMQAGYGWERALHIMRSLHRGDSASALEMVDARHAALHESRRQAEETRNALRIAFGEAAVTTQRETRGTEPLRIGEAALLVGVRVSAIRFWEQAGLLQPRRDRNSRYRLYDTEQVRRLRVVTLLRNAGYSPAKIAPVLTELTAGRPESALAAVERRRAELTQESRRCAEATAAFCGYVQTLAMESREEER